jgi:para-aminobenzoate synthetase / 4-amino-4-deoxychorismate lyase
VTWAPPYRERVLEARFDDLTPGGTSFRLVDPVGVLEATRVPDVAATIAAAEAAAARGLWVAGFVTYEAAPGLDPALRVRARAPDDPLPLAWFAMFDRREETQLPEPPDQAATSDGAAWHASVDRATYDAAIAEIHERIGAGDTYQVNHTLRLRSVVRGDVRGLYRDLCFAQRGAYGAYVDTGRVRVASASPELFFRIDGRVLTTKPMKGTAPRGRWPEEDEAIRASLQGSVKDRAENAMIVDLLRNDLGRVARAGTVRWTDVFDIERYETVWQLTSTVSCDLLPDVALVDVFRALFPCGSVTGAPKVSTMAIIAALEDSPRGVYCGTVGYLAPTSAAPQARFNVAIRTVVVDAASGGAEYGVGGGITWDSRAASEYDETVAKARVLTARRPRFDLLESLRHEPGTGYRRLDEHLTRLQGSAAYFGFAYDEDEVRRALDAAALVVRDRPAKVRLTLNRRGRIETTAVPIVGAPQPVRLAVDATAPVDPADVLLFHKTTLRARYDDAKARHPDADDVVLVNTLGSVTETTVANLAASIDGTWWTPPLDDGLLPGTEREALIASGELKERSLTAHDLREADAIEVLSSVRGRRRAVLMDD